MARRSRHETMAAGVIERADAEILIVRADEPAGEPRTWRFPRVAVESGESPEAALRRHAAEALGLSIEIIVGQPPVLFPDHGRDVEFRYFLCGLIDGNKTPSGGRWIPKGHLREYDFDAASQPIADWMAPGGR